ncbi:hypothetical protein DM02DRAFT_625988 [Periconia macrospinosa]|uniref:Uncharacterized protein n=1 Tax=Periconia macrospinosa TaxID=97972 RepID=A0A2V1DY52_9PLEO|nr:hypothetical protein DM02DRAFT_625988 [Periconia macrospinosa]
MSGQEPGDNNPEADSQKSKPFSFRISNKQPPTIQPSPFSFHLPSRRELPASYKPPPKPEPVVFGWENENVHQNTPVGQIPKQPIPPHKAPAYYIGAKGRWVIKSGGPVQNLRPLRTPIPLLRAAEASGRTIKDFYKKDDVNEDIETSEDELIQSIKARKKAREEGDMAVDEDSSEDELKKHLKEKRKARERKIWAKEQKEEEKP